MSLLVGYTVEAEGTQAIVFVFLNQLTMKYMGSQTATTDFLQARTEPEAKDIAERRGQ